MGMSQNRRRLGLLTALRGYRAGTDSVWVWQDGQSLRQAKGLEKYTKQAADLGWPMVCGHVGLLRHAWKDVLRSKKQGIAEGALPALQCLLRWVGQAVRMGHRPVLDWWMDVEELQARMESSSMETLLRGGTWWTALHERCPAHSELHDLYGPCWCVQQRRQQDAALHAFKQAAALHRDVAVRKTGMLRCTLCLSSLESQEAATTEPAEVQLSVCGAVCISWKSGVTPSTLQLSPESVFTARPRVQDGSQPTVGTLSCESGEVLLLEAQDDEELLEWRKAIMRCVAFVKSLHVMARLTVHVTEADTFYVSNVYAACVSGNRAVPMLRSPMETGADDLIAVQLRYERVGAESRSSGMYYDWITRAPLHIDWKQPVPKHTGTTGVSDFTCLSHLRELRFLRLLAHPQILNVVHAWVIGPRDGAFHEAYIASPYMPTNLYAILQSDQPLMEAHSRYILAQVLDALKFMHASGFAHTHIHPGCILLDRDSYVRITGFDSARCVGEDTSAFVQHEELRTRLRTRMRNRCVAPEILLAPERNEVPQQADMWGIALVYVELCRRRPLFVPYGTVGLFPTLETIFDVIGTPHKAEWIEWVADDDAVAAMEAMPQHPPVDLAAFCRPRDRAADPDGLDLLRQLLVFSPLSRLSAETALQHAYFHGIEGMFDERTPVSNRPVLDVPLDMDLIRNSTRVRTLVLEDIDAYNES